MWPKDFGPTAVKRGNACFNVIKKRGTPYWEYIPRTIMYYVFLIITIHVRETGNMVLNYYARPIFCVKK